MRRSFEITRPTGLARQLQRRSFFPHRNLYWSWYEPRNFGDWVGPYLYEAITGRKPWFAAPRSRHIKQRYYFTGSILNQIWLPGTAIVWGSGIISRDDAVALPREVLCVRGPHSRERLLELGYPCPEKFGDPAVLLPDFYQPEAARDGSRIGLIPHFIDYKEVNNTVRRGRDFVVIDVCRDVESVVRDIAACGITISSSLHGIIVSHAYGVPSIWISSKNVLAGDGVKFDDYFAAVGITDLKPYSLEQIENLAFSELQRLATLPNLEGVRHDLRETCPI